MLISSATCTLFAHMQSLDKTDSKLGLTAEQLAAFTVMYSNVPKLQLDRLLLDWSEVEASVADARDSQTQRHELTW